MADSHCDQSDEVAVALQVCSHAAGSISVQVYAQLAQACYSGFHDNLNRQNYAPLYCEDMNAYLRRLRRIPSASALIARAQGELDARSAEKREAANTKCSGYLKRDFDFNDRRDFAIAYRHFLALAFEGYSRDQAADLASYHFDPKALAPYLKYCRSKLLGARTLFHSTEAQRGACHIIDGTLFQAVSPNEVLIIGRCISNRNSGGQKGRQVGFLDEAARELRRTAGAASA